MATELTLRSRMTWAQDDIGFVAYGFLIRIEGKSTTTVEGAGRKGGCVNLALTR